MAGNKYITLTNSKTSEIDFKFIICSLFFVLLTGLSLFIGFYIAQGARDYLNYENYYKSLTPIISGIDGGGDRFEIGFKLLTILISKAIPLNTRLYYSIIVFIALYSKFILSFKYFNHNLLKVSLFFVFYILSFMLVFEVNQIREAIALSFGFFSIYYLHKDKKITSIIFFLLSFCFHYTSIIFLIPLFSIYFAERKKIKILMIAISIFTLISEYLINLFKTLNPEVIEYSKNYEGVVFNLTNITFILAVIFFIYHFINIKNENPLSIALLMLLYSGIFFYVVIDIPVYQIRILELTEVSCMFIAINRKFKTYFDVGSLLLLTVIIFHKFIAFTIINPLF